MCSDAVELSSLDTSTVDNLSHDTLPLDSLSRDGRPITTQLKPEIITPSLTSVVPDAQRDITRSAELVVTNSFMHGATANSARTDSDISNTTLPSNVMPVSSALLNTAAITNRASKVSLASQQHPKLSLIHI